VRTYHWPSLEPEHHLHGHRAAVNAAALCGRHIVTASGDRSVRIWDAESGALLHALEGHHERGIAATDVRLPFVLTGSSDEHLRLVDVHSGAGWATAPELAAAPPQLAPPTAHVPSAPAPVPAPSLLELLTRCGACGAEKPAKVPPRTVRAAHSKLVRSVRLTDEFAVSASYDATIKVWDRASGKLVADLTGGHTGRVFAVDIDATKVRLAVSRLLAADANGPRRSCRAGKI
jgi:WD40 repeat protein